MERSMQSGNSLLLCSVLSLLAIGSMTTSAGHAMTGIEELQGNWMLTSAMARGKPLDLNREMEIKDNRCLVTTISQLREERFTIDAKSLPAKIDRVYKPGPEDEWRFPGVFEVKETSLIICEPIRPTRDLAQRPKSLESKPGSDVYRMEYRRISEAPAAGSSIAKLLEGLWELVKTLSNGKEPLSPVSIIAIREFKDGVIKVQAKSIEEYKLTLVAGSQRVDLLRMGDKHVFRALLEYDPAKKELTLAQTRKLDLNTYPADFSSTEANSTLVEVYKKQRDPRSF